MAGAKKPVRRAAELDALRQQLEEAQETLRAIRSGEVDALVVSGAHGEQVYTLKDADRTYRQMVEQMSEGALTLNGQGIILFVNACVVQLLGVKLEQVMGTPLARWVVAEDLAVYQALVREAWRRRAKGEIRLASARGEAVPVELSLSLLQSEEGPRLTVIILDLSERKRAEESLREAAQSLRQMNQELEQRVMDRTAALEKTNTQLEREIQVRLDAERRVQQMNQELKARAHDLEMANEELHAANLQLETEIAERRRIEREIQSLNRTLEHQKTELELANKELESFSYSISHDLRAPLGSIGSMAGMLLQDHGDQLPEEARLWVDLIHKNSAEMTRLVEGLLSFSRSTRQPLLKRTVDVTALTRQVLEDLKGAQAGRRVDIVLGTLPPVQADPVLLKQVLTNLLSNALKFTRQCHVARIEIDSEQSEHGETVYFVRDNGAGFDMERADKLFGVFQRLHSEEEYEGTGVGLAIVERIVRRHGGHVWAESEEGKGATFYFTLGD